MRTLLRHALTGQYYQASGKWTVNPKQAHDFGQISRAVSFARSTNSPNLEIDLSFDDPVRAAAFRLGEVLVGI